MKKGKAKKEDITKPFAQEVLVLIGMINANIRDPNFAKTANSLLTVKAICTDMLEGKRIIK